MEAIKRKIYIPHKEIRKESDLLVFFTPEAGVTPHYISQCLLARTYQELGYRVAIAGCRGLLSRCPVMDMHLVPHDTLPETENARLQICGSCINCNNIALTYGLEIINLSSLLTSEIRAEFSQVMNSAPVDLRDLVYEGIEFGKLSARDVVFSKKTYDFANPSADEIQAWRSYIETSLTTYLLTRELAKRVSIGRLLYFNEYSSSLGAVLAAKKAGIPVRSITNAPFKGVSFSKLTVMSEPFQYVHNWMLKNWGSWRELPLTRKIIEEVTEDLLFRSAGKASLVYSPGKSAEPTTILDQLNLSTNLKTLVAYTSSMDEFAASHLTLVGLGGTPENIEQPFKDQAHWLESLIAFVESRPDTQLIIRIHPREGKTKRDGIESKHLALLKSRLSGSYSRSRIIWPEDPTSSYDLAEVADLILTSWSTLGLEMARCGVPIVTSFRNRSFPSDDFLLYGGDTPEEYLRTLENSLRDTSASINAIARAYRCFYMFNLSASIDFDDQDSRGNGYTAVPFTMPAEAPTLERLLIGPETSMELNYQRVLDSEPDDFKERYRHEALKIILQFMGIDAALRNKEPSAIDCSGGISAEDEAKFLRDSARDPDLCIVAAFRDQVIVFIEGELYRKRSKLLGRLGVLLSELEPRENLKAQHYQIKSYKQIDPISLI